MTDDEILAKAKEIEARRTEARLRREEIVENRIRALLQGNRNAAFEPKDLCYAAFERCSCGAGMAYPKECGMRGSWHCSSILLGTAEPGSTHSKEAPFMFYSLLSEDQKSRTGGATTRPAPPPSSEAPDTSVGLTEREQRVDG